MRIGPALLARGATALTRYFDVMPKNAEGLAADAQLLDVADAIRGKAARKRRSVEATFATIVRQALDEVIDGPRTGRWSLEQLSKTEKAYVGTKIEILVKSTLLLESGIGVDALIADHDVDIKWSQTLDWMIAPENVDKICLGLGLADERSFSVGVFWATPDALRGGANRDGKLSLTSAARRDKVLWLVSKAVLPADFVAELPNQIRRQVFAEKSAQDRIRKLAELVPMTAIPRQAFLTVAKNKADAMRRLRRDALNVDALGDMVLLSTKYRRRELEALGMHGLPKNHWVSVPKERVPALTT